MLVMILEIFGICRGVVGLMQRQIILSCENGGAGAAKTGRLAAISVRVEVSNKM